MRGRLLALDQSLKVSGWAVFDTKGCKLVDSGVFKVSPDKAMYLRLGDIWSNINELHNRYEFDSLYIEDIQLQAGNALTYKHLAYVQATILLWAYFNDVKCEVFAASHWRKLCGGSFGRKREEQKQHAVDFVRERFGKEVSNDEADAICIGYAAWRDANDNAVGF